MTWGSPVEIETRRRILVAVWAYAYEVEGVQIVDDAIWDREAYLIDLSICTTRPDLDRWFRANFGPETAMWVRRHPEPDGLRRIAARLRLNGMMGAGQHVHDLQGRDYRLPGL